MFLIDDIHITESAKGLFCVLRLKIAIYKYFV